MKNTDFERYGLLVESLIYGIRFDPIAYSHTGIVRFPPNLLAVLKSSDLLKNIPPTIREKMFDHFQTHLNVRLAGTCFFDIFVLLTAIIGRYYWSGVE